MGTKAGKFIKAKDMQSVLESHYGDCGISFAVSFSKTKGDTCKVLINKKQAVAGVTYDGSSKARPAKDESSSIADEAHSQAEDSVKADEKLQADKKKGYAMPKKKINSEDIRSA